jgi:hypothetical protein
VKALFFHAVAGNPKVTLPLMTQAWTTIRPFSRYLGQAIHTAKQRQTRYQLSWERVRNLRTIHLEPVDTLLRIPKRRPGVVFANWPVEKAPDLSQQGFVMNRGVAFGVEEATLVGTDLRVKTTIPLLPSDSILYCGVTTSVRQEMAPLPPEDVKHLDGRPVKPLRAPRADGDLFWLLTVDGVVDDCDLVVDGEEVEAEVMTSTTDDLRRVVDSKNQSFPVNGRMVRTEELPADGFLDGEDGIRYRWTETKSPERRGHWIQLLPSDSPSESAAEEFMDPRAAFCEGDLEFVWTQQRRHPDTTFKVKKVDQDRYQIQLDRFPPEGSTLYLPVDQRNLQLQRRALKQLGEAPLPHHQGLLRLCEDPERVRWPAISPVSISTWHALTDVSRDGTNEQRAFVSKALGTLDFAFLEGPPGSGKTTAICEIVQQLVQQGKRVLLCASTHVAIDNVLERLVESKSPIDAVRIGKIDKVDNKVQATQLDQRVERLLIEWRKQPAMQALGNAELDAMAERTVIMAANLTCGTTMGIVSHPLFRGRDEDVHISERPISTLPHWDVLIVDEASKTLIQEFLVPALMAKRWIIVGDVRQLPPFTERADIVANLRDLVDENDKPVFPADHQRACLLLNRLLRARLRQPGMRWLLAERPGVLDWIASELVADPAKDLSIVRIAKNRNEPNGPVDIVTVAQLRAGKPEALKLAAADWVLVGDDVMAEVADLLPSNLLFAKDLTTENGAALSIGHVLLMRQAWWLARTKPLPQPYVDKKFRPKEVNTYADCQAGESDWLMRNDLANELAWRLTRVHELRQGQNTKEKERLRRDLAALVPAAVDIDDQVAEIEDIGLPSILEVLQEGIGVKRANRPSALTVGFKTSRPAEFAARFESLSYQHRMHADIAAFSREVIYAGSALKDANTIQIRDLNLHWDFGTFRSRRVWADIEGREHLGVNADEINLMRSLLSEFFDWVRGKGPPNRTLPRVWEVACLCFYTKQERAISDMLRELTRDDRKTRFEVPGLRIEIVCGTVDRFQGREADLVLLSMRNTRRIGFLDSPNRLNVAVTRARQQLVVVGSHGYFSDCGVSELQQLAQRTPLVNETDKRRWRRR